jgi:putative PIN family toxin of toxin-antitoxin system
VRAKPFQVVLDTSVLVAGVRSTQGASFRLLQLVGDDRWQINLSPALLFEYEEAAKPHADKLWAKPERFGDLLDFLARNGRRPRISYSWRPQLSDADDEMVLELAVAAQADFIVTHNVRDFAGAKPFGVGILTPSDFLKKLEKKT